MGDRKNNRTFPAAKTWRNKPALTPRQEACVDALIDGLRISEIAQKLGVRSTCVSEIVHDAMYRTGCKTREQLAAWWAVRKLGFRQRTAA
jgi:DNA-binding NarL/FixJ family response regulator